MADGLRIGIDLGGTKIEGIVLDAGGRERARRRIATPRGDYGASLRAMADLVADLDHAAGGRGTVGIGIPGVVSPRTGLVKNANSTWLNGRPLNEDLAAALDRPVRSANDANCLAVSEAVDGAGAGAAVVFAVILGTGVGAGIAIDGRAVTGANAVAGEWGHNPLPWPREAEQPGRRCYCGRHGCLETWLSGPALEEDYRQAAGRTLTGPALVAAAAAGEPEAMAALDRHLDRLARGLAHVVNILDPDMIVIGGGLSAIGALYDRLPALLPRWVFGGEASTPIRPALHGDSSGVRGAAWLWTPGDAARGSTTTPG